MKSRFVLKRGVLLGLKSAISVEKGCFSPPESAKRGYFSNLGTSVVYVLVGRWGIGVTQYEQYSHIRLIVLDADGLELVRCQDIRTHRDDVAQSVYIRSTQCNAQWRHNERDSVSNHRRHDCLLNRLFRRRSKKTSKLCVTGLCGGNSPVTDEFPAQRASNAENVSIWWRHHGYWKSPVRQFQHFQWQKTLKPKGCRHQWSQSYHHLVNSILSTWQLQ